jgi:hypothetical protein
MSDERKKQDEEKSLKFMLDPNRWPRWPYLPVKKYPVGMSHGMPDTGVVLEGKPTVYIANLYALPRTPEGWEALQKHEYLTFQALVNDGWIVD